MTRLVLSLIFLLIAAITFGFIAHRSWELITAPEMSQALPSNEAAASTPNPGQVPNDYVPPSISEFSETLESPVFFRDRRFPTAKLETQNQAAHQATAVPLLQASQIKLRGVMISSIEEKALIEHPLGRSRWYQVGEYIQQWQLTRIENNQVVLSAGGHTATLKLYNGLASD